MIYGIGTDIAKVERFNKWVESEDMCERFFNKVELMQKGNLSAKSQHYAARFAAKEAFAKALGTGFSDFELSEVFITNNSDGKPILNVCGKAEQLLKEKCGECTLHVSLSHEKEYAIAYVIIEKN